MMATTRSFLPNARKLAAGNSLQTHRIGGAGVSLSGNSSSTLSMSMPPVHVSTISDQYRFFSSKESSSSIYWRGKSSAVSVSSPLAKTTTTTTTTPSPFDSSLEQQTNQSTIRSFSSDPSTGFKQLVSPRIKNVTIIEPPVRSRPFRPFRAARILPTRSIPKRVAVLQQTTVEDEKVGSGTYPVQAIHAAQKINLASILSKVFATKGVKKMMERLSVVVQLPMGEENKSARFVAVFRFGSVVFVNVAPREAAELLVQIKKHAVDPVLTGVERKESFCVHVHHEELPENPVTGEYCVVQELNMKSVDVITNVMAQSVALDAYSDMVDELLAEFATINHTVKGSGKLTTVEQGNLFKTVAQNNSIFIDMVSKLGIKDRSDTAWNLSQYEDIHQGMKEEFEINIRFKHIEFKLDLIQQNAKFFLEVLHNQKSNTLEHIIIVLIGFECVLMCMDMSGVGPLFFEFVSQIRNN